MNEIAQGGISGFEKALNDLSGITEESFNIREMLIRMLAACFAGWLIGQVYRRTFTGKRFTPTLPDTNMLLCLGGALIWAVVGNSIVRAFGLAGTIGLIRYRTIVRDPKDTTILLFSMIIGMACGLGNFSAAFAGTFVVCLTMVFLHVGHQKQQALETAKARELLTLLGEDTEPKK